MTQLHHTFHATAFEQNFSLKSLAEHYPTARMSAQEASVELFGGGTMFLYPFGAVVFHQSEPAQRDAELVRLRTFFPELRVKVAGEEHTVLEDPDGITGVTNGTLTIVQMTAKRASVIALTVAQSAAMEYYEHLVEELGARTNILVVRLRETGRVPFRTRALHRFIGESIEVRSEVLSVLHLLDKPDATWDDPAMDAIYEDLQDQFDLEDRFAALESKLRIVQEALELVLDTARDHRLVLLEVSVVALFVLEIVLGLVRH